MLRDFEKTSVFSLLVRQLEAEDGQARAEKELEHWKAVLSEAKATRSGIKSALKVYGLDLSGDRPWTEVKQALGQELWEKAFSLVRPKPEEGVKTSEEIESPIDPDPQENESSEESIKIKSIVLESLTSSPKEGVKASTIRGIVADRGITIHDKTVGMTLYRLLREGIARREGHVWYLVPEAEREEPSDGTSGQDSSEGSGQTPQAEGREAAPGGGA